MKLLPKSDRFLLLENGNKEMPALKYRKGTKQPFDPDTLQVPEEVDTIDLVIDTFNKQVWHLNKYRDALFARIDQLDFAYPNDNEKLKNLVECHTDRLTRLSVDGLSNIFNALTGQVVPAPATSAENSFCLFENCTEVKRPEWTIPWLDQTEPEKKI